MLIRTIEVENWRCIGSLTLEDLPDGIVVLSGPNRTGKSSLHQAIRSCLFDHDHNSQDQIIKSAVPWHVQAIPRVRIEFELGGKHYRIDKKFSPRKEGEALLEEKSGTGWKVLEKGKEASRKTRELAGVDKSQAGLFQLLWLDQGVVKLPEKVDGRLTQAIEEILGTMITGRDVAFKEKLDKACLKWFTPRMGDKKESPVSDLRQRLQTAMEEKEKIESQFRDIEATSRQYEEARLLQPHLEGECQQAEKERDHLQKTWEATRQRWSQHQLAIEKSKQAQASLNIAKQKMQKHQDWQNAILVRQTELDHWNARLAIQQKNYDEAQHALGLVEQSLGKAQASLTQHQEKQLELEDRQSLWNVNQKRTGLENTIAQVEKLKIRQQELENSLAGPPGLSETEFDHLCANRREAQNLQAELRAAEIRLTFIPENILDLDTLLDDLPRKSESVSPTGSTWNIRQKAELILPGIGIIRIARGSEGLSLEEKARRLAHLDREYQEAMRTAQVDYADPHALDQIGKRKIHCDLWTEELKRIRNEIQKQAPQGQEALKAAKEAQENIRQTILDRHADWITWVPCQTEIETLRAEFQAESVRLQKKLQEEENKRSQLQQICDQARNELHQIKLQFAQVEVALQLLKSTQQEMGSPEDLSRLIQQAESELAAAEHQVQATALTEQEQDLEQLFQEAEEALKRRQERLRHNELDQHGLRIKLEGTEGLHLKRIQAEQTVDELASALAREELHAQAHRQLRELFECVRQEQVRRTVGPVSERVMKWARHLGLEDYAELEFGDHVLPGGMKLQIPSGSDDAVALDEESYGTVEQLSLLIRLALGGLLARKEPAVAIFDDPLAHADPLKHRRFLEVLRMAAEGSLQSNPPTGPLQILLLTCHPERFDFLTRAKHYDLQKFIQKGEKLASILSHR